MMSVLLEYENQLFMDMFNNDGLLIMADGLGIERIFTNFIKLYSDPSHLVLILNTQDAEEQFFINKLKETKELEVTLPIKITTETFSLNERTEAYMKGGCFFVTSRILVVDMLCNRIPMDLISGILVYNAHSLIDSCQETFILRMFRQSNKKGFIKAFSDSPVYFSKSFCKVDRIMKNLFVKKLYIYPRFHVDIESELSKHRPELIEIHVGLSELVGKTQMALFDIVNVLLQEFKGCCSYIDHDFLTMEMVISKPFDQIIKSQLEPVWNHLGTKPKQLLSDIKTLRLLLYYLTQYDCITFYKMLNCLRSHEKELGRSSGWMFLDAANELFANARLRVYGNNMKKYTKADMNKFLYAKENKEMASKIIKESPKLKALKEILEEISNEESLTQEINILITANDDRTCSQIKHFLTKNHLTIQTKTINDDEAKVKADDDFESFDILDDKSGQYEEKDDEFIVKMILKPSNNNGIEYIQRPQNSKTKKLLKKAEKNCKKSDEITLTQMIKKNELNKNDNLKDQADNAQGDSSGEDTDNDSNVKEKIDPQKDSGKKIQNTNLFLSAYSGGVKQKMSLIRLLNEIKPKYVILYDCELRFVRQLEVFKLINYQLPLRVYLLMYSNSCEEQRYLTSIRCEKESFELLIKEKAAMIVHEEQDGKIDLTMPKESEQPTISSQMNSRQGGNLVNKKESEAQVIIVDMREFRSELPSILHKKGFHIEPVTLEVGDYVITANICVERKSINDLIESLANGRLYNQSNAMSRAYRLPVLLIEFDQKKPFLLNSHQALASNEISIQHTSSKLVLLVIHFPKLRILWCSNPSETAEIFEELKSGCEQPNAEHAMSIKNDQVIEDDEYKYNPILWDLLLKIPGVNSKNIKSLMSKVENLYELCQMSESELTEIIENSRNAKLIFEFFNKTVKNVGIFEKELDFEDLNEFFEAEKKTKSDQMNIPGKVKATTKKTIVKQTSGVAKKKSK